MSALALSKNPAFHERANTSMSSSTTSMSAWTTRASVLTSSAPRTSSQTSSQRH
uniref:Uncharacterized protein n=1 Tax=Arundo donax TaxID=35708 RepID=A0A0A9BIJ9_ARUDO